MSERGLRSTEQRRAIVSAFFDSSEHVSIDELLERVKNDDNSIGYATVYRTLKMLVDGGIAEEHKFADGLTRYELASEDNHHDHMICIKCRRIQEFSEPLIEQLQERIADQFEFELIEHKHELYGLCSNCSDQNETPISPLDT